jgi:hypothetical protein
VITPGNEGSLDDLNVIFNGTGVSDVDPVVGRLNATNFLIGFDSTDPLTVPSSGQARVEAASGTFTDFSFFSLAGGTFTSAILNLQPLQSPGPPTSGTVTFTVERAGEADFMSGPLDISTNGNNFFAIEAINGQQILSVSFTSSLELSDVRQVRIGGAVGPGGDPVDPIPEPMSMALLGSGLAAIGIARQYRKA